MASQFIKAIDLDDFIRPGQSCIKPVQVKKSATKVARIEIGAEGETYEVQDDGVVAKLEKVEVSLADCLACSGCVTSAETVLVNQQSTAEFLKALELGPKAAVVTLSAQSRASLATHFKCTPLQLVSSVVELPLRQVTRKLKSFFARHGVEQVLDARVGGDLTLLESAAEFLERMSTREKGTLPMLTSSCPGWVCYAEKKHGEYILPYISTVKSPQQMMGTIVKRYLSIAAGCSPEEVYHAAVMPCFDKKLEATREDFYDDVLGSHDVDTVITTSEVLELLEGEDWDQIPEAELSPTELLFTKLAEDGESCVTGSRGGSGGVLEHIFRAAASALFGHEIAPNESLEYKVKRNKDMREVTLEQDGQVVLKFAAAYGFRNIQNLVRNIKRGKSDYHFVEVMACPGGCINGGGQIPAAVAQETPQQLADRVNVSVSTPQRLIDGVGQVSAVFEAEPLRPPETNQAVQEIYAKLLDGAPVRSETARRQLHTQYHQREAISSTNFDF